MVVVDDSGRVGLMHAYTYLQVVRKQGDICYHFTSLERDNFVPAAAPLTEVFRKLRGEWIQAAC
jgi:hypothetical protein